MANFIPTVTMRLKDGKIEHHANMKDLAAFFKVGERQANRILHKGEYCGLYLVARLDSDWEAYFDVSKQVGADIREEVATGHPPHINKFVYNCNQLITRLPDYGARDCLKELIDFSKAGGLNREHLNQLSQFLKSVAIIEDLTERLECGRPIVMVAYQYALRHRVVVKG